jgi:hypothetical protein
LPAAFESLFYGRILIAVAARFYEVCFSVCLAGILPAYRAGETSALRSRGCGFRVGLDCNFHLGALL